MTQLLDQLRANRPMPAAANAISPVIDIKTLMEQLAVDWRLQIAGLRFDAPAVDVRVLAERDRLIAVLNHLIQNAADAAGAEGHVTLSLAVRVGQSAASAEEETPAPQWAEIVVADDGPGMDPAFVAEKLFQPLDSTKAAGFGIGAYQCRQQVREMGGRLLVDSVLGGGTRMIVRLPLAMERTEISRPEDSRTEVPQGKYRHG
jgi:signal transduction histidine kinase